MFLSLLHAKLAPHDVGQLATLCRFTVAKAAVALAHLEKHGWVKSADCGWRLTAGLDCDCPKLPRKATPAQVDAVGGRVALYRLYDAAGVLLYIGITDALRVRMRKHAAEQPWWPEVARKTVAWYDDREAADQAETLAIAAEKPVHNKAKVYAPKATVEFDF